MIGRGPSFPVAPRLKRDKLGTTYRGNTSTLTWPGANYVMAMSLLSAAQAFQQGLPIAPNFQAAQWGFKPANSIK